jgi:hypothetical protein
LERVVFLDRGLETVAPSLGPDSGPVLIEALEHAGEAEQYAALLALRLHGYEVWGDPRLRTNSIFALQRGGSS